MTASSGLLTSPGDDNSNAASRMAVLQLPERAHIKSRDDPGRKKSSNRVEAELSEAMSSSLQLEASDQNDRNQGSSVASTSKLSSPERPAFTSPFGGSASSGLLPTRPVTLAHAPTSTRRRSSYYYGAAPMLRRRSLSFSSLDDLSHGDPFAWLRQTVQEQRLHANDPQAPSYSSSFPKSLPATPGSYTAESFNGSSSLADITADVPFMHSPLSNDGGRMSSSSPPSGSGSTDYFGAGLLSLVAGKGPVRQHVSEDVRRTSVDAPSRFSLPTMPAMPSFQAPSFDFKAPSFDFKAPAFQVPSMPEFKAPALPTFKTPSASSLMPESFAKMLGANAGEGESRKYMDEADQTNDDEPDWARIKDKYDKPKLPMVFLHGLFGFSVLGPSNLPAFQIQYWRGVREALEELGVEVLMTASPASGNIETRAKAICEQIIERFPGREINLIGHSMGGLDARYLITHLQPQAFTVRTLTTIATPHRGSPFADYLLDDVLGRRNLPSLLTLMNALQMPGGGRAFDALTTTKMAHFNEETPDDPEVQYYSYGAQFRPSIVDVFRLPWSIISEKEGENDGLVSVASAKWGNYKATLENVNHLDLVGWVGRVRFAFAELTGKAIRFKPVSFYLAIAEELAKAGY